MKKPNTIKNVLWLIVFSLSSLHLFSQTQDSAIFNYTGSTQTLIACSDSITVIAWGGGGAGGGTDDYDGAGGGGGAYVKSTIPINSGEPLTIIVGGGGGSGTGCVTGTGAGPAGWGDGSFDGGRGGNSGAIGCSGGGGGGGGASAVLRGATPLIVAGGAGGGSGGGQKSAGAIGGGGGQDGNQVSGSCSSPGISGGSANGNGTHGIDMSSSAGASGDGGGGGGGGGGYKGGTGGGVAASCDCGACGGGGGSSWSSAAGAIIIIGNGQVPGNNTILPAGLSVGAAGSTNGGNGYVKIIWKAKLPTASIIGTTTLCTGASAGTVTITGANSIEPYTFTYNINGGSNQIISSAAGSNTVTLTAPTGTAGSYTYSLVKVEGPPPVLPPCVTTATVETWGAGGSGSAANGGGGGAYASVVLSVVPGNSYAIVIGTGGAVPASGANGNDGGNSSFDGTSVVAAGGKGGTTSAGGAGGTTASSTGTTTVAGGNGATGTTTIASAGGPNPGNNSGSGGGGGTVVFGITTNAPGGGVNGQVKITTNNGTATTATFNTAGSYTWTNTCATAIACSQILTESVVVTVNDCSSCTAAAISLTSTSGTDAQTLCINTPLTAINYSVTGGGTGAQVVGLPAGVAGAYAAGVFSINGTPSITGTFNYTVTTSGGCAPITALGTITVNQIDNPSFSYNPSTVCKASNTNPILSLTGTPGGTFTATAGLSITSAGTITTSATPLGTYTVTYTTSGACPQSSTNVVNIVDSPVADFHYGIFCQNVIPNPTPIYFNGGIAGTFSEPTGNLKFVSTSTGEVNLLTSVPATYTVTNTISTAGCPSATSDTTITINPVPATTVNSKTICAGSSTALTASGAASYVWALDNSILDSLQVSPLTTTSYTVTGSGAGCSSTATGTVTVNQMPTVIVNNPTVCTGIGVTMTASGATSYLWSTGFNSNPLIINPGVPVSYTVTGTSSGCSSTASAIVMVNPLPIVGVNSPVICQGLPATLTATGAVSYVWNTGSNANPLIINPAIAANYTVTGTSAAGCTGTAVANVSITLLPVITVNSPTICLGQAATLIATGGATLNWSTGLTGGTITVSPNATTPYTVLDNTPGCSGSATGTVTVNQPPVIGANSATICLGQPASLLATGASSYVWSNGSLVNPINVSPTTTTSYTVTGTTPFGCKDTTIATVTVNQPPVVTVNSTSICERRSATLIASGANSYNWSNGSVIDSSSVNPITTSSYTVTGTNAQGCIATAVGKVTVFPKPGVDFSATPNPAIISNPTISFTNQSSHDVNYWNWNFGDGDSLLPNQPNPVHTYPTVETTYTVTLIVHNAGMCYNNISHEVVIGPEYSFFIPNAFSPDGDGINDVFLGKGQGIIQFELMVFDRWGNFIFYADNINKGWDGRANAGADIVQQDVYIWKVSLTDIFNKKHSFIGTVTLVKGR